MVSERLGVSEVLWGRCVVCVSVARQELSAELVLNVDCVSGADLIAKVGLKSDFSADAMLFGANHKLSGPQKDALWDKDIDYSDIPPLDKSFFKKATAEWPPAKQQVTVRLDTDVLDAVSSGAPISRQAAIARALSIVSLILPIAARAAPSHRLSA